MDRRGFLLAGSLGGLSLLIPGPSSAETGPHRIVIVGDTGVGKTSFLVTCSTGAFPGSLASTAPVNHQIRHVRRGEPAMLDIEDTVASDDYDSLRPRLYPSAAAVIIAYSAVSPSSLTSAVRRWSTEIVQHNPGIPRLLVGMKSDLRAMPTFANRPIARNTIDEAAHGIGAYASVECSALRHEGVFEALDLISDAARGLPARTGRRIPRGQLISEH